MGDIDMDFYFNTVLQKLPPEISAQVISNWIVGDLNALLKEKNQLFSETSITPERLIDLVCLIHKGAISGKMAKALLPKLLSSIESVQSIVDADGGCQISDESELLKVVNQILEDNSDVVEKIKKGKTQAAGFLMGQVMKVTQGKAQPDLVRKLILSEVEKR
jgi:aspartyl-tRNA(Asn)/glutamyl-tRNA(Gln) amidotransferase subunit B